MLFVYSSKSSFAATAEAGVNDFVLISLAAGAHYLERAVVRRNEFDRAVPADQQGANHFLVLGQPCRDEATSDFVHCESADSHALVGCCDSG